jgi:hypothetical protein
VEARPLFELHFYASILGALDRGAARTREPRYDSSQSFVRALVRALRSLRAQQLAYHIAVRRVLAGGGGFPFSLL